LRLLRAGRRSKYISEKTACRLSQIVDKPRFGLHAGFVFFVGLCNLRIKAKPSGLPDCNFIFFVATKKAKQKKAWRGAWHVFFGAFLVASKVV
jgi:hypothetical protein